MRLGWTKNKNPTTYRAVKTIRVDGTNKTLPIKTFDSDCFICETYGVTDAKAWAKEQVRLMNEAERDESASFNIELNPSSKKSSFEESKRFIEQPSFELHDIYRALSVIAEESDYIQSRLFKNSSELSQRKPV